MKEDAILDLNLEHNTSLEYSKKDIKRTDFEKEMRNFLRNFLEDFERIPFSGELKKSKDFSEAKNFFSSYLKNLYSDETEKIFVKTSFDVCHFLSILKRFRKVSERDGEILLRVLQEVDFCFKEDIQILSCLYSHKLSLIKPYTVFQPESFFKLKVREIKFKNMTKYAAKKALFYIKKASDLIKECELSLKEYEAFLWLRGVRQNIVGGNPFAVWIVVLSYLLFSEAETNPMVFYGPHSISLGEVVRNVFVKKPNFSSVLKTYLYLSKNYGQAKEDAKKLKFKIIRQKSIKIDKNG